MRLDHTSVAVVTGGASGLGLATVLELVRQKVRVVVGDFNQQAGEQLVREHSSVRFFKTNVVDEDNVRGLIEYAVKEFGAIHLLVNCAGVSSIGPTVSSKGVLSTDELIRVLKINVVGSVNASKYAALQMSKQEPQGEYKERGLIVHVASLAGIEGQRGQVAYSASKGAIIGLTLPMARDLGRFGIRVVTLAPGVFVTPMADHISQKVQDGLKKATAIDRLGDPREFADCVVSLCTNSYITGEVIRLDGGCRMPHL